MFRAGAIPLGVGLRICMEGWGAICARIDSGALGRASLKEKHHKSVISANHNLVPRGFSLAWWWGRQRPSFSHPAPKPGKSPWNEVGEIVENLTDE